MAQENLVSIEISQEELQQHQNIVAQLSDGLGPILKSLTPSERQTLVKLGDKTVAFIEKVIEYSSLNPEFIPPYVNMDEMAKDVNAVKDLQKIYRPLNQLCKKLEDTITLAGSEAVVAGLGFYSSVNKLQK